MRLKPFRIERPGIRVLVQLEVYEEPEGLVCGIRKLKGRVALPPRKWLQAFREEIRVIERLAKSAGCIEMRLGGRRWARILTDYEPFDGVKNGLRKGLNDA